MSIIKNSLKKTFLYPLYIKGIESSTWQKEKERLNELRGPVMAKYLPKGGIGAELGVYKGHFSRTLLERTQPKQLHLIDPWYFLEPKWQWSPGNQSTLDALCHVLQTNKKEIDEQVIFVHVQDDIIILNQFPDQHFDWAYIDSTHAYEQTVAELELLHKKVKSSGIICGDDWRPDSTHKHHGVYLAVVEFMEKYNYELLYASEENLQWFIKLKK